MPSMHGTARPVISTVTALHFSDQNILLLPYVGLSIRRILSVLMKPVSPKELNCSILFGISIHYREHEHHICGNF